MTGFFMPSLTFDESLFEVTSAEFNDFFFIKFRCALGSASLVYAHLKEKLQLVNPGTKLFFMNSKSVMPPPRLDIKNICHFQVRVKEKKKKKRQNI